jgi:hypothetical protein
MRAHREKHPECLVTGMVKDPRTGKKCDVAHAIPVAVRADLATEPSNFRTLLPTLHLWASHGGNTRQWNTNLDQTIAELKKAYWTAQFVPIVKAK